MNDKLLLDHLRGAVARARADHVAARAAADAATPGGLHGDPATVSGVRRSGGHRSETRRLAAYGREAAAGRRLAQAERALRVAEAAVRRAAADATAPCNIDALCPGDAVRDRHGWHRVVRVNASSVTVETAWSWTDRIPRSRIIETRAR